MDTSIMKTQFSDAGAWYFIQESADRRVFSFFSDSVPSSTIFLMIYPALCRMVSLSEDLCPYSRYKGRRMGAWNSFFIAGGICPAEFLCYKPGRSTVSIPDHTCSYEQLPGLVSILSTGFPKPRSTNESIIGFPVFSRAQKGFGDSNSTPMVSSSFLSCSRTPAGVFFESSAGAITAFALVFFTTYGRAARRSGWMPIASIRSHSGSHDGIYCSGSSINVGRSSGNSWIPTIMFAYDSLACLQWLHRSPQDTQKLLELIRFWITFFPS